MKTVVLTMDHEGELPTGFLKAMEARAYDYIKAKGGDCGEVTAQLKPLIELPVVDMEASDDIVSRDPWPLPEPRPFSLDGSPIKVNHD